MARRLRPDLALHALGALLVPRSVLQVELDLGRCREAEGLRHLREVQLVDVEAVLVAVGRIRVHVRPVSIPRATMQVVVLLDHALELRLNVGDFIGRETVLCHRHACFSQVLKEPELLWQQEEQGLAYTLGPSGGSPDAMDVLLGLVWRIELNDPIDLRDVEAARSHICAAKDALLGRAEIVVRGASGRLLLLTVNALDGHVDVIQQLVVKLDCVASREKYHDLLVFVPLQEGEEQQESAGRRTYDVTLRQARNCCDVVQRLHFYVHGLVERDPCKVGDLPRLRRREQSCLPLFGQQLDDHVNLLFEPDLENSVGLIDGQVDQIVVHEALRVLHVVKKPAGRSHNQVHALGESFRLRTAVHASDAACNCLRHVLRDVPQHVVNLLR
mmetsp:Transcript_2587/g.9978  ORF Transcript_2587/g.9978 Transcript_2587/m.9978 type:complete len:386 (-) Transcript_2587:812-1969(-)